MARIRTIKPSFWTHPLLSRVSDRARLLAIALLNLADDEGYFLADPALVRNFARPLDAGTEETHGAITELSVIEWIKVRDHASHGRVGHVVNFTKHQRINRPSTSELSKYFRDSAADSVSVHGSITERSHPEGKGREGKGKERDHAQTDEKPSASATGPLTPEKPEPPPSALVAFLCGEWPDVSRVKATDLESRGREFLPAVDLLAEAKRARGWEAADPSRRKVKHAKFVWGWWSRCQERGGTAGPMPIQTLRPAHKRELPEPPPFDPSPPPPLRAPPSPDGLARIQEIKAKAFRDAAAKRGGST